MFGTLKDVHCLSIYPSVYLCTNQIIGKDFISVTHGSLSIGAESKADIKRTPG